MNWCPRARNPNTRNWLRAAPSKTLTTMLDMWSIDSGGKDDRIVDEAGAMLTCYLAPYIEKNAGSASRTAARRRH